MRIGVKLDDLANELTEYAGIALTLSIAADLDVDIPDFCASTANIIYKGLDDIVDKMKILSDREIPFDKLWRATTPQPDPFRVWLKTHIHNFTQWHLATEKQIDQIRELLDHDESIEESNDGETQPNDSQKAPTATDQSE